MINQSPIQVSIVGGSTISRAGLTLLLAGVPGIEVSILDASKQPDIVIWDAGANFSHLPEYPKGASLTDAFFKLVPRSVFAATLERGVCQRGRKRVLVGSPASPGQARGIARVIDGPEDFLRFKKGDVLVARATSPIWTPLLGIASAAVTEVGGPFAHAAIVAREFGIPLVDGALDATRMISDGTPVVVDGSAGTVEWETL